MLIFMSFPSAKKPKRRPSGAQKGIPEALFGS
jgi:hypothetical protein